MRLASSTCSLSPVRIADQALPFAKSPYDRTHSDSKFQEHPRRQRRFDASYGADRPQWCRQVELSSSDSVSSRFSSEWRQRHASRGGLAMHLPFREEGGSLFFHPLRY